VECDRTALERNVQTVRPGMRTLSVSAKTGEGMAELVTFLEHATT
jgi:Ni2+-binding GTPase involved in maturation of urease and hydrogenase